MPRVLPLLARAPFSLSHRGNDPDGVFLNIDVAVWKSKRFADAYPGVVQQRDQEGIAHQMAILNQRQHVFWLQPLIGDLLLRTEVRSPLR